jgi:cobalt-zinc-cadmium efflux system protein
MQETRNHYHVVSGKNLGLAILLNVGITLAEAIGGIISGSMALLSDAAHNFSDVLSLIISYFASRLSKRKATEKVIIIIEAIRRLMNPAPLSANLVIWLAIASILINGLSALFLRKDSHDNINIRSAYLHLFGDMLTSVAVLAGGLAIKYLKWTWSDSVFSLAIALYLLWLSWGIFRSSLRIIMQFTPEEIDIKKIACEIEKIPGVKNIHHVHVWQINDHDLMFEAHIDMSEDIKMSCFEKVLEEIKLVLNQNGINHSTIQPEFSVDDKKQIIY